MFRHFVVAAGVILSSVFLTTAPSFAVMKCIAARCAIITGGTAAPGIPAVVSTPLGPGGVTHPAVGVYCIEPSAASADPYTPVVSVSDDQSVSPGGGAAAADGLAEIGPGPLDGNPFCPVPLPHKAAYLEIDTYSIIPGAGTPIVVPSDSVGFNVEY
jgi:hypothetical protein